MMARLLEDEGQITKEEILIEGPSANAFNEGQYTSLDKLNYTMAFVKE